MFSFLYSFLVLITAPAHKLEVTISTPHYRTGKVLITQDSIHREALEIKSDAIIKGKVQGDLHVHGGRLVLEGSAGKDVSVVEGSFDITGDIDGDLTLIDSHGSLRGRVSGTVAVLGGELELDSTAVVDGDLVNLGASIRENPGALVKGEKVKTGFVGQTLAQLFTGEENLVTPLRMRLNILKMIGRLGFIALTYLLGLLFMVIFPRWQNRSSLLLENNFWRMLLAGVILQLVVPGLAVLLLISLIGTVIIPFLLLAWLFIVLVSVPQGALWVGEKLKKWWNIKRTSKVGLYSLGFLVLYFLSILASVLSAFTPAARTPYWIFYIMGLIVVFVIMTFARGAVAYALFFPKEARSLEKEADEV